MAEEPATSKSINGRCAYKTGGTPPKQLAFIRLEIAGSFHVLVGLFVGCENNWGLHAPVFIAE